MLIIGFLKKIFFLLKEEIVGYPMNI